MQHSKDKAKNKNEDEIFLNIAEQIAKNSSTCLSRHVGAVLKTKTAVVSSYNGASNNQPTCKELGYCIRKESGFKSGEGLDICRAIHAEHHALINLNKIGGSPRGGTIYVNTQPCDNCAKKLIMVGIARVVYRHSYPLSNSLELFKEAGVEVDQL